MSVVQLMSVIYWPFVTTRKGAMNAIVRMVLKEMDSTAQVETKYLMFLLEIQGNVAIYKS